MEKIFPINTKMPGIRLQIVSNEYTIHAPISQNMRGQIISTDGVQTDRQTDRQTDGQIGKWTDRLTG